MTGIDKNGGNKALRAAGQLHYKRRNLTYNSASFPEVVKICQNHHAVFLST